MRKRCEKPHLGLLCMCYQTHCLGGSVSAQTLALSPGRLIFLACSVRSFTLLTLTFLPGLTLDSQLTLHPYSRPAILDYAPGWVAALLASLYSAPISCRQFNPTGPPSFHPNMFWYSSCFCYWLNIAHIVKTRVKSERKLIDWFFWTAIII